jgi:hypothetical protein
VITIEKEPQIDYAAIVSATNNVHDYVKQSETGGCPDRMVRECPKNSTHDCCGHCLRYLEDVGCQTPCPAIVMMAERYMLDVEGKLVRR